MTAMHSIELDETYWAGAATVERVEEGLRSWRLPHTQRHLFPSPEDSLMSAAGYASGVRLRFETDASQLELRFAPLSLEPPAAPPAERNGHAFDLVIDDEIVAVTYCDQGATRARFDPVPPGRKIVELWLPPSCPVTVRGLDLNAGAVARPLPDRRPLWVTWGSSLTHCVRAGSAARTWPGTVARRCGLNLHNLGFGGQCHLDPMVARFIRDLPAAYISLKLGINTIGGSSVNARTYPALVTAAVEIIREKHPHTPLVLISPFSYPPHETTPNPAGYTIGGMRRDMRAVWERLVGAGDLNLYYVDGLDLFSLQENAEHTDDQCHAGAAGIDLQAEHVLEHVMPLLLGRP